MKHNAVVFDIDGTMCYHSEGFHEWHSRKHCECVSLIDPVSKYMYTFKPYIFTLIDYLLSKGVRIAFFSAGDEERNEWLVEDLLTFHLGVDRFELLKQQGQFKICSKGHVNMEDGVYRKDLCRMLQKGEDLTDIILIDDTPDVVVKGQTEFISCELFDSHCEYDHLLDSNNLLFYKNGVYYLLGLFKNYFEDSHWVNISLRSYIGTMLFSSPTGVCTLNTSRAIASEMIKLGLDEVRRSFPEAILYGSHTEEAVCILPEISDFLHSPAQLQHLQECLLVHCSRLIEECTIQVLIKELKEQKHW